jgi:hypothetical protein
MIDITGRDKAELLAILYNGSSPRAIDHIRPVLTKEEAQEIIEDQGLRFDYLRGRMLKIDLRGNELRTACYNRDNGRDTAELLLRGVI